MDRRTCASHFPTGTSRSSSCSTVRSIPIPVSSCWPIGRSIQVAVVDKADTVGIRTVKLGQRVGAMWVVADGLVVGERVVAEGVQKVRPGMVVKPVPFEGKG